MRMLSNAHRHSNADAAAIQYPANRENVNGMKLDFAPFACFAVKNFAPKSFFNRKVRKGVFILLEVPQKLPKSFYIPKTLHTEILLLESPALSRYNGVPL